MKLKNWPPVKISSRTAQSIKWPDEAKHENVSFPKRPDRKCDAQFPIQWMPAVIYVGGKQTVTLTSSAEAKNRL